MFYILRLLLLCAIVLHGAESQKHFSDRGGYSDAVDTFELWEKRVLESGSVQPTEFVSDPTELAEEELKKFLRSLDAYVPGSFHVRSETMPVETVCSKIMENSTLELDRLTTTKACSDSDGQKSADQTPLLEKWHAVPQVSKAYSCSRLKCPVTERIDQLQKMKEEFLLKQQIFEPVLEETLCALRKERDYRESIRKGNQRQHDKHVHKRKKALEATKTLLQAQWEAVTGQREKTLLQRKLRTAESKLQVFMDKHNELFKA
ncbi:MAG: hypothetical protein OXC30_02655 [Alphaproteobacteria bacterium]|nr:hypothetical protein [Alphaproteobacteria bacterium]